MKIKEAIKLLEIDYGMFPDDGKHYLKGIQALKKQLEVDLVEFYPYNLALAIYGKDVRYAEWQDGETSEDKALKLSIAGIEQGLNTLTDREKAVLQYRFKNKMTLEQVAKEFEVTRERIRQIEAKALRKLRHPSRLAKMKAYSYEDIIKNNEKIRELEEENKLLNKAMRMYIRKDITREELEKLAVNVSIYDIRIEDLDLSVRSYNCLKRKGINNLGELSKLTYTELITVRNLGKKSVDEVIRKLKEYNIELKENEDED